MNEVIEKAERSETLKEMKRKRKNAKEGRYFAKNV